MSNDRLRGRKNSTGTSARGSTGGRSRSSPRPPLRINTTSSVSSKAAEEAREKKLRTEKHRREEAEMQSHLEQEVEKLRESQHRIMSNDKHIRELQNQLRGVTQKQGTEVASVEAEIAKWKQRAEGAEEASAVADVKLVQVLSCEARLKGEVLKGKIQLICNFCLMPSTQDVVVAPSDIFSRPLTHQRVVGAGDVVQTIKRHDELPGTKESRRKYCSDVRRELDLIRQEMGECTNGGEVPKKEPTEHDKSVHHLAPPKEEGVGDFRLFEWAVADV